MSKYKYNNKCFFKRFKYALFKVIFNLRIDEIFILFYICEINE